MKNLKMILPALIIFALSVFTGCSDSITSSGESNFNSTDKAGAKEVEKMTERPLYHGQIRLKPNRSYTFNIENTGLSSFTSSEIKNISPQQLKEDSADPCRSLFIYRGGRTTEKKVNSLNCYEEKLDLKEITVQNTGSSFIEADVILFGTRPSVNIKEK